MARPLEWMEPPSSAFKSEFDLAVDDLRAQPGRWARVKKDMKSGTGIGRWKKAGLEAVTATAESDPALLDYFARAPENAKPKPATPLRAKLQKAAPSAAPAAEANDLDRQAEEDAAYAAHSQDGPEPQVIVPVPPNDSEASPEAKAVTEAWRGRLGHKQTKAGGRRG